jgi:archaellum component FlaC
MEKNDYITKEYFEKTLDGKLELMSIRFERHITDLVSGFNDKMWGAGDQVKALGEKITSIDHKVSSIEHKVNSIAIDVLNIKEQLKEKTDKKDTFSLRKRIIRLETQNP